MTPLRIGAGSSTLRNYIHSEPRFFDLLTESASKVEVELA